MTLLKEARLQNLPAHIEAHGHDHVDFGDWQFQRGPDLKVTSSEGILPSQEILNRFVQAYYPRPGYENWMFDNRGVPSPIIRIDFSPEQPDFPYEVEARPAGLGIYTEHFGGQEQIRSYFDGLAEHFQRPIGVQVLPSVRGGVGKKDRSLDSRVFAQNANLRFFEADEVPGADYLLWARGGEEDIASMGQHRLAQIEAQSLTPVRDHGNKVYLPDMGLATYIHEEDQIDFTRPFCIKPVYGSKSDGVGIYLPGSKSTPGVSTRTQIGRLYRYNQEKGGSLVQEYIPPAEITGPDGKTQFLIFRIFAGYQPETHQYALLGGCYFTRPNVKIHGASDALVGKVEITS